MSDKRSIAPTIKKQVYAILKNEICNGDFADGQWLLENDISSRLNVSRSPIREALRQLVSDGFLIEVPNRGVYVREVTTKDIIDIYEMRKLLESYAIKRSPETLTPEVSVQLKQYADELEALHEKKDLKRYMDMDRKLHDSIARLSDNAMVIDAHDRISSLMQRFRRMALLEPQRFYDTVNEHRLLVQSIISGDVEAANKASIEHTDNNKIKTLQMLAANKNKNPDALAKMV